MNVLRKSLLRTAALAALLSVSPMAASQNNGPFTAPPADEPTAAVQLSRARAADDQALRHYDWSTWLQLFRNGALANQAIIRQSYLANGRLQRAVVNQEHASLPGGFIARTKWEDNFLADLQDLLAQYRPTSAALLNFVSATKVSGPDATGALVVSAKNVIKKGDVVTVWFDAKTRQLRRLQVATLFRDDPVQVNATYGVLPNGPSYMQYAQVEIPDQKVYLLIHNYDYGKSTDYDVGKIPD